MNKKDEKAQAAEAAAKAEKDEGTLEDLMADLPIPEKKKQMLSAVFEGLANNLVQLNNRLATLEKQPAAENSDIYEGLTAEQKYQVLMAKASAPGQTAQTQMWQTLLGGARGGGGSEIDQLVNSADKINSLRAIFSPAPSPVQEAMERAQIAQVIAQSRLMNKVAGSKTSTYLDKLETDLSEPGAEPGSEGAEK